MSRFLCPQIFYLSLVSSLYRTLTPLTLQKSLGKPQAPTYLTWSPMVPVRSETVAQARPPEKGWGSRKDEALAVIAKTLLELLQQGSWQSSVSPTG